MQQNIYTVIMQAATVYADITLSVEHIEIVELE